MKTLLWLTLLFGLICWWIPSALALTEETKGTPVPEPPPAIGDAPIQEKLDLNTASMQELLRIPGLGDDQVLAIMNGRPYEAIEELLEITGIDEPVLTIMRDKFTVIPQTTETPASEPLHEENAAREKEKVNINTASLQELLTLPGLGKKRAQALIDGRPYAQVEDLLNIPGIDEKRLTQIRNLITVMPLTEESKESEEKRKKAEEQQREEQKRAEERDREEQKREEERDREKGKRK